MNLDYIFMDENELSKIVIGVCIDIHKALGPGLLENAYQECLYYKLKQLGMRIEKEVSIPLKFEEINIECGYRIDLLVENKLLIELKSVAEIHDIYMAQTLTYLRVGKLKLGLLINFNVILLKDGIRRVVNGL